jgi:hypothetical protein
MARDAELHDRIEALEGIIPELPAVLHEMREIASAHRDVIERDIDTEKRLGALEKQAVAEGKSAGASAGSRWGVIGAVVGTIVTKVFEWMLTH